MPDVALLAKAVLVAALVAAAVMWLTGQVAPRRWWHRSLLGDVDWSWAIGFGVMAASGVTDQWPHWPPLEDRARFLTLLIPLALLVETVAAATQSRAVTWSLRVGLAALVAPVLLHNTVYLADLSGPNSAKWSSAAAVAILVGLGALLAMEWALVARLQVRTTIRTVQSLFATSALATACTVMLSGYFRAGLLGLGLTGAIAGALLASFITKREATAVGSIGMSVVGVFSVAVMGRFFGALSTSLARLLVTAPLLAWIVELPRFGKLSSGRRAAARWTCVVVPLFVVVVIAERNFVTASNAHSGPPRQQPAPSD